MQGNNDDDFVGGLFAYIQYTHTHTFSICFSASCASRTSFSKFFNLPSRFRPSASKLSFFCNNLPFSFVNDIISPSHACRRAVRSARAADTVSYSSFSAATWWVRVSVSSSSAVYVGRGAVWVNVHVCVCMVCVYGVCAAVCVHECVSGVCVSAVYVHGVYAVHRVTHQTYNPCTPPHPSYTFLHCYHTHHHTHAPPLHIHTSNDLLLCLHLSPHCFTFL